MSQINSQYTQAVSTASLPVPGVDDVLGGAIELIEIKTVLDNVLERVYGEFDDLLEQGPSLSDERRYWLGICSHVQPGILHAWVQAWIIVVSRQGDLPYFESAS